MYSVDVTERRFDDSFSKQFRDLADHGWSVSVVQRKHVYDGGGYDTFILATATPPTEMVEQADD